MAGRCAGKLALVTGAAQGLGRAHATRLAEEGARVLCTDINGAGAAETAKLIDDALGAGTAFSIAHDVTDPQAWEAAVDAARDKLGGLNVLVNNAGIGVGGNIETCDFDDWKRCFAINVDSIFHGCQKALPLMRDHAPGSIVNISSIAGLRGNATIGTYGVSKAAEAALARNLAVEWGPRNIRVNSIAPGLVRTDFAKALTEDPVRRQRAEERTPVRRIGEPVDIAGVALFLASPASAYVTGQTIVADGGETIC